MNFEKIPQELKNLRQWVCWKSRPKSNGKMDKLPVDPKTGKLASSTDPETWTSFNNAFAYYQEHSSNGVDGIGFVFTEDDPYSGIDFDHCFDPKNNELDIQIQAYLEMLHTYSERSPSKEGLHAIAKGELPVSGRKNGKVEVYQAKRFFTMTGNHLEGTPKTIENRSKELLTFYRNVFGDNGAKPITPEATSTNLSDDKILEKIADSKNCNKFNKLTQGDWAEYESHSEADLSYCSMIALQCGNNPEQIDRLFRKSKLYRAKWDEKHGETTYGEMTIKKAIQGTTEAYSPPVDIVSEEPIYSTDLGNARRFIKEYGDLIRFNWSMGKWLYYDGVRWNLHTGEASAKRLASNIGKSILSEASKAEGKEERKALANWAFRSESSEKIRAMLELAKSQEPIACYSDDFDQNIFALNILNGTVDLRTGELHEHNPADMLSKLAPVTWMDEKSSFDGDQKWLGCCITWMKDDKEAIDYLQRLGGMCLTGDTTSRVFPIFWGTGKNGKNVFLDTLMKILGDYATVAPRTLLRVSNNEEHATELADLVGKRLVVASETSKAMKLKTALVKSMTGDARLKGRFMRQDLFEFSPTHKVVLMTQNLPVIDETTDAIWDRVHKMKWGVRIPLEEQDTRLQEKLQPEWPYILGWFIEGCLKWQEDGYLKPTKAIIEDTVKYRQEMNPLNDFINEECVVGTDNWVTVSGLKKAFDEWFPDKNKMTSREFNSYMTESGYLYKLKKVDKKPVKCWIGIRLQNNYDN